jgi:hypothetical protein
MGRQRRAAGIEVRVTDLPAPRAVDRGEEDAYTAHPADLGPNGARVLAQPGDDGRVGDLRAVHRP